MLADEKTRLDVLIDSGKPILVMEMAPPDGSDLEAVRSCARRYASGFRDRLGGRRADPAPRDP
jgi:hypothetical protein